MKCGRGSYKGEVSEGKCWFSTVSTNTGVHRTYLILANFKHTYNVAFLLENKKI